MPDIENALVTLLETLLDQARSGNLTGLSYAAVFEDGQIATGFICSPECLGGMHSAAMLTARTVEDQLRDVRAAPLTPKGGIQ